MNGSVNDRLEVVPLQARPRIGSPAPQFEADSTRGPVRLQDYRGSWLVLFSHPADFTPVCTTEFLALAELAPEFKKRGVELLGVSLDSVFSHIAWLRNIAENFGVTIPFPIIADPNQEVAGLYEMMMPGESKSETVRSVYVIDPTSVLRAMLFYPLTVGRNTAEILRLIDALQIADRLGAAVPANWKPGDPVAMPAPKTVEAAARRSKDGHEYVDWYFCKRRLD
jgi:peroxiredoxin (alkyl hydroperoxide reductase subunit C)